MKTVNYIIFLTVIYIFKESISISFHMGHIVNLFRFKMMYISKYQSLFEIRIFQNALPLLRIL